MKLQVKKFYGKVIHKGSGQSLKYLDQLSDEIIWINCQSFPRYLWNNYNINPEEYYNLVKYGNKNFRECCEYCFKPKNNWTGKLFRGYTGRFCCHSCARSYHISHPEEYPSVAKQVEYFNKQGIQNPGWNLPWSNTKKARSQFLSHGTYNDTCIFYLAINLDGKLKLGITSDDLATRLRHQYMNNDEYITIHEIYKSTRIRIANLEALIKYQFNHQEYLEFSELHKVLSVIKNLIKSNLNDYPY